MPTTTAISPDVSPGPSPVSWTWPAHEAILEGRRVRYALRRSGRSRHVSLWIRPDTGLVATAPERMPMERIEAFIARSQRWILRQLDRMAETSARLPRRWPFGATLPFRGQEHEVRMERGSPSRVQRIEGQLLVQMRAPGIEGARRLLRAWYRAEAAACLSDRVAALATPLGLTWGRLSVRDQRWRWGSCSPTGNLSFNYRLIMAPPPVLDYVVVHELMHRRELNHSRRFWALVAAHCPEYRRWVAWLRTDGPYLTL